MRTERVLLIAGGVVTALAAAWGIAVFVANGGRGGLGLIIVATLGWLCLALPLLVMALFSMAFAERRPRNAPRGAVLTPTPHSMRTGGGPTTAARRPWRRG